MTQRKTILIADNSTTELNKVVAAFKPEYSIVLASDGLGAMAYVRRQHLDGAVLDWAMNPGATGDYVAEQLRKENSDSVIAIRSSSIDADVKEVLERFGVRCFTKSEPLERLLGYFSSEFKSRESKQPGSYDKITR